MASNISQQLSILVIDENRIRASVIEAGLRDAGYDRLTIVEDVTGIARRIVEIEPDVIVISLENPNRDMLENLFQLSRAVKRPIAMFVDRSDQATIEAAVDAGVSAYIVDGLAPSRLAPILRVAMARFEQQSNVRQKLDDLEQQLRDRKDIDRAKGLLMDKRAMSEAEAYAALRQQAMRQGLRLADVARRIIAMADLLG